MQLDPAKIVVECNGDGVTINGQKLPFPAHYNTLVEMLGEPSYREHDLSWYIGWDDYGIFTSYGVWDKISDIKFLVQPEPRLKNLPQQIFKGQLLLNGEQVGDLPAEGVILGRRKLQQLRYRGEGYIYCNAIITNFDFKEDIPKDKYKLPTPTTDAIDFKDFNFKLLVIEELMYNLNLINPQFDVYEFAKLHTQRKININEEGYELIPEVVTYFEQLPIDKNLAQHVTKLYQDGGNEVYMQLCPFWDGEDSSFDIENYADVEHFPNLKKMTLLTSDEEVLNKLQTKGIQAETL